MSSREFPSPLSVTITDFVLAIKSRDDTQSFPVESFRAWYSEKKGAHHTLTIEMKDQSAIVLRGLSEKCAGEYGSRIDEACEKLKAFYHRSPTLAAVEAHFTRTFNAENHEPDPHLMLNYLVIQAFHHRASDIHFKPESARIAISYRIDGLLAEVASISPEIYDRLLIHLKNTSRLMAYKKSIPQDGRISFCCDGCELDIRVAMLPTFYGERTVLRLLEPHQTILPLECLGFEDSILAAYRRLITRSQGIILLTGPAGSGKTTTIFSSLLALSAQFRESINISTIEDPIEYIVERFSQTQVNPAMGLTFASGLRTLMRQDPNVLLVGEIRDQETAAIALQAALSGHLVFSTIHSSGAAGVFPRLMDMGLEPYLVSEAVTAVLHQRLVRKVCLHCSCPDTSEPGLREEWGSRPPELLKPQRGRGCPSCNGTGYRGRTGIFELLEMTPPVQDLIYRKASRMEIIEEARSKGYRDMKDDLLMKVSRGSTTFDEMKRLYP